MSGLSIARWVAVPPADDTALARSQVNSSSAFLIVFVVAAVPGDGAAAFDFSNPAHAITSRACLGFAFHVKPAGLQDRTRFSILVSVPLPGPMIEITVYCVLQHCFHNLEHIDPRLHHEVVPVHTRRHHRPHPDSQLCGTHFAPPPLRPNQLSQKLLPLTCRFPRAVMSLDQQPHDSAIWLGFCWWMCVYHAFHVCVK